MLVSFAPFPLHVHHPTSRCSSLLYLSQRPTHSGSIFRLLLKIAVGLPRSCDSSQFLQGFGPNKHTSGEGSNQPPARMFADLQTCLQVCRFFGAVPRGRRASSSGGGPSPALGRPSKLRPLPFARMAGARLFRAPLYAILAVGAEALPMTPSGGALFAS